jgi:hypothetical protein
MIILFTALTLVMAPAPASPQLLTADSFRNSACPAQITKVSAGNRVGFQKLGNLPDAHMEIAVNRTVSGCPAPMIVRYNVSRR